MITVALVNRCKQPLPWTLEQLAEAGQEYAELVGLRWGLPLVTVIAAQGSDEAGAGVWPLFLNDHTDRPDCLAYHAFDAIGPWGISFLGETVMQGLPAEVGVFHELAEMLVNPHCQLVLPRPGRPGEYLFGEIVDPVQSSLFLAANGLHLPNFVLPAWFGLNNWGNETTRYDHLGALHAQGTLGWGGYCSCWSAGAGWQEIHAGPIAGMTAQKKRADPISRIARHHGPQAGYETGRA